MEQLSVRNENEKKKVDMNEEIQKWASYRAQTLSRTVKGMMYYRQALELQYVLKCSEDSGLLFLFRYLCLIPISDESSLMKYSLVTL
ncbi:hypothetical protein GQ457_07G006840 [Hibiscus cannabinus]